MLSSIRRTVADYAAITSRKQAALELLLMPPLLVAGFFTLIFAVPILEAIR